MVVGDFAIELDTVVIGAGPGGYVAAIRAAQEGHLKPTSVTSRQVTRIRSLPLLTRIQTNRVSGAPTRSRNGGYKH